MKINTILFDLDGTLLDTNELIRASFEHTFNLYNISYTDEELIQFNGPPLLDTFAIFKPEKAEEMVKTYRSFNIENHDDYVSLFPNTLETLDILTKKGVNVAIVTNKIRQVTLMGLRLTGLDDYFTSDRIITLTDVGQAKPHPEGIIKAMNGLDSNIETTLMVGDSYHDIEAGHHAGVKTAGVSWSDRGEDFLRSYNPTYMIDNLSDLIELI